MIPLYAVSGTGRNIWVGSSPLEISQDQRTEEPLLLSYHQEQQ